MKATITSIELKGLMKFFLLSAPALKIMRQLKSTDFVAFKKQGVWKKHYTMTLWKSEEDLKKFATGGAHLHAMKDSGRIAKEIKTITIDAEAIPTWKEAKELLKRGKVIKYSWYEGPCSERAIT